MHPENPKCWYLLIPLHRIMTHLTKVYIHNLGCALDLRARGDGFPVGAIFIYLEQRTKERLCALFPRNSYLVDLVTCSFRRTATDGWSFKTIPTNIFMERCSNLPWYLCACGLFWSGFCWQIMTSTVVTIKTQTKFEHLKYKVW